VLDDDRHAQCPDCGTRVHCGIIGLANLEKRHRGTKTCIEAKDKRDKEAKKKKNGSLLTFFLRPRAVAVPSIIPTSAPVHSYKMPATEPSDVDFIISATSEKKDVAKSLLPRVSGFLDKLQHSIKNIPDTVPEAGDNDTLAIFSRNPKGFDHENLDPDSLWEEVLNPLLKSTLGWGTEGNMDEIIRRGSKGVEGLLAFVKYFIEERGVSDSLFEGKLSNLMHFLETK
jgi:hypothetical protein